MEHPEPASFSAQPSASVPPPLVPEAPKRSSHAALLIVFLVVFIDLLGFGIVLPLLPRYAKVFLNDLIPGGGGSALGGVIMGLLYSSFSVMQFIFAPVWGRLSDRAGRRPILLLGLAGSVVFYALFGIASGLGGAEHQALALVLLFVARIGQGISGATIATAQAVIADSTTPERRSRGMALVGAAFGIGFTFGPLFGALAIYLWPGSLGAPGYVAAGLSLIALLLGLRLLPETLRPDSTGHGRRAFRWDELETALKTPAVGLLIITFFLATFAFANFEATLSLLTLDTLQYTEKENFWLFAYIGLTLMLAQGGLYQMLARRGVTELTFMTMGVALLILGLGGLGGVGVISSLEEKLSHDTLLTWMLLAITLAVTGFAFLTPSAQALISRRSDPAKQGEILGINQSAAALARILGPAIGLSLYNVLPSHSLPYAVATVLLLVVVLILPRLR
ncbi:MAG: MFS transporter [Gemmataceae bacterium]|nr:MFS transporter [Gemmataceae bacterium]